MVVVCRKGRINHRNYVLVYDLTGDLVRVLRILHAGRYQFKSTCNAAGSAEVRVVEQPVSFLCK